MFRRLLFLSLFSCAAVVSAQPATICPLSAEQVVLSDAGIFVHFGDELIALDNLVVVEGELATFIDPEEHQAVWVCVHCKRVVLGNYCRKCGRRMWSP